MLSDDCSIYRKALKEEHLNQTFAISLDSMLYHKVVAAVVHTKTSVICLPDI